MLSQQRVEVKRYGRELDMLKHYSKRSEEERAEATAAH